MAIEYTELIRTDQAIFIVAEQWQENDKETKLVVPRHKLDVFSDKRWREIWQILGQQGWELVTSNSIGEATHFYFKREKIEDSKNSD